MFLVCMIKLLVYLQMDFFLLFDNSLLFVGVIEQYSNCRLDWNSVVNLSFLWFTVGIWNSGFGCLGVQVLHPQARWHYPDWNATRSRNFQKSAGISEGNTISVARFCCRGCNIPFSHSIFNVFFFFFGIKTEYLTESCMVEYLFEYDESVLVGIENQPNVTLQSGTCQLLFESKDLLSNLKTFLTYYDNIFFFVSK